MPRDTYETQEWHDLPQEDTPVNSERLGHIEQGVKTAMDNRALKEVYGDDSISMGRKYQSTVGRYSYAFGDSVEASGRVAHAEGNETTASGNNSHAEGNGTIASGNNSHAEGYSYYDAEKDIGATGEASHAEGYQTTASGGYGSHAEGNNTESSGNASHAEGNYTKALGDYSHAEGNYTKALGDYSHAEGGYTEAHKEYGHAEGYQSKATGMYGHAEGYACEAGGYSHAEGYYTKANGISGKPQSVRGSCNIEDLAYQYLEIVGNGTSEEDRSNAYTLDWEGNAWFAGDVENGTGVKMNDLDTRLSALEESGGGGGETNSEVSLVGISSSLLSTAVDITEKCSYQVTGQSLEIDLPMDGICLTTYMNWIFGGLYWGEVAFQNRPPHTFIAQISGQYRGQISASVSNRIIEGFADLINDNASMQPNLGKILHGTIDLSDVQPILETVSVSGTAKITFDMTTPQGKVPADVASIQIFKALPINDIMTRLAALEEKVNALTQTE